MPDEALRTFYRDHGLLGRVGFGHRPCLLLVDFIRGFTDPACPLGADLAAELEIAAALLDAMRLRALPVHFTTLAFGPGAAGPFVKKIPALALLEPGSRWTEVDPRVAPRRGEPVWNKQGASAFFGTGLAPALVARGVDTVIVTGCTTSGCVRASAVDACQHGFQTAVVREAVGDRAAAPHTASLFDLDAKYADVVSHAEVSAYLQSFGTGGGLV
jgi:nicotinamidase-related amidase